MNATTIEQVRQAHTDELMAIPGVLGTAVGLCEDAPCILVFAREDSPALRRAVPVELDGYPVRVEATGEIRALPEQRGE